MSDDARVSIIVALDGLTREEALNLAKKLESVVWGFKVNDLFFEYGVSILKDLSNYGKVFCDAKFHDIPNTVNNSMNKVCEHADIITIHASGGEEMVEAASKVAPGKIAAVTVLTSIGPDESRSIYGSSPESEVILLASKAELAGATYMVCSGKELKAVQGVRLKKIVPGIRPKWFLLEGDDQKRVVTPAKAIKDGANFLVIGRPIVKAEDPQRAVEETLNEVWEAQN